MADKGGELTLTSDIEIDHDINVINDGVLHLNGFTVTGKNGAKLTIGEKVVSKAGGEPAKLRIEGNGTVSTPLVVDGGELTIAGGYYAEIADVESTITVESGKLIIEGGVFNGENVIGGDGVTTENVTIEGGTFKDFDPDEFVPDDKKDDVVTLPEGTTIVTAANAISAIKAGGNILLVEDVILPDRIVLQKSTTIDLGGNSITSNESGKDAMVITGNSTTEVTIKNGTFVSNGQDASFGIIAVQKDPKVTIEDVNIEGINPIMMYSNGAGTITINSGTFISTGAQAVYYYKGSGKIIINGGFFKSEPYNGIYYTLNILDSNRPASGDVRDAIEVRGGTFVNFDPSNNKAEGSGTNFVADGYKVISYQDGADTIYEVVPN